MQIFISKLYTKTSILFSDYMINHYVSFYSTPTLVLPANTAFILFLAVVTVL